MAQPIHIHDIALTLPHRVCFESFTAQVHPGSRIALIGRNGSGKSTLLKMLKGEIDPSNGKINLPQGTIIGYVPQIIEAHDTLSGGQRFQKLFAQELAKDPDLLVLDEPTNHLDATHRKHLMRQLDHFQGTLILATHDLELLRNSINSLWHIDEGHVQIFSGNYDDYCREMDQKRQAIEEQLTHLASEKKETHQALMKEQIRASKSKAKGIKSIKERKWPTVTSKAKANRAANTTGRKKAAIVHKKQDLMEELATLRLSEIIKPKFSLSPSRQGNEMLISINEGQIGYLDHPPLLHDIRFTLTSKERVALGGNNGCGKSTLIKAILGHQNILKEGDWHTPQDSYMGYLDQHYNTLCPFMSVFETIEALAPHWSPQEIRRHLNDFLFRKNEEINAPVAQLSGGEKARLCLAQIGAKTPKLLILDEVTNNLDLGAKEHVIGVLKDYPGSLIIISHDEDFIERIGTTVRYKIEQGTLS